MWAERGLWGAPLAQGKETKGMQTTYYTLTAREIVAVGDEVAQAAGGSRRLVYIRRAAKAGGPAQPGKVIDLAAWRASREGGEDTPGLDGASSPAARRPRRDHGGRLLLWGEALATLSVMGTMLLLAARALAG